MTPPSFRTWFPYRVARRARPRLICLPHAGAGAVTYSSWQTWFGDTLEVCAAEPPGRWSRAAEPPLESVKLLADSLANALAEELDRPFLLFGHSLGALVAFELCRTLRARWGVLPQRLIVSGRPAPQAQRRGVSWRGLSDAALLERIASDYAGMSAALFEDKELLQWITRATRADLHSVEGYVYEPQPPLSCAITALGGDQDNAANVEELAAWQLQTTAPFALRMFPGGHFYTVERREEVLTLLRELARDAWVGAGIERSDPVSEGPAEAGARSGPLAQ